MSGHSHEIELDVTAIVRGDIASLHAVAVGNHELQAGAGRLAELLQRCGKSKHAAWDYDSCHQLGDLNFVHADALQEVVQQLEEEGHRVETVEARDWPQLDRAASIDELPGLSSYERAIAATATQQGQGQIVVTADITPDAVASLVQTFPHENILVVAKSKRAVRRITWTLLHRTTRPVSTGQVVPYQLRSLLHVDALPRLCRSTHDFSVLIFADLESARSSTGIQQAAAMPDARIYAIRADRQPLDWEDAQRLRLGSGPVIYHFDQGLNPSTEVVVFTVRAARQRGYLPSCPVKRRDRTNWNNPKRNGQVANIATAFATNSRAALHRCHIPVEQIEQQLEKIGPNPRVAIITEIPEQARHLRRLLPGWRLASGTTLADKHAPTFPLDEQKLIVTRVRAKAAGLAADVVIRADGNDLQWCDDYGPHWGFDRPAMLVVDIQDRFDAGARRFARERVQDYQQRGWAVIASAPRTAVTIA